MKDYFDTQFEHLVFIGKEVALIYELDIHHERKTAQKSKMLDIIKVYYV